MYINRKINRYMKGGHAQAEAHRVIEGGGPIRRRLVYVRPGIEG